MQRWLEQEVLPAYLPACRWFAAKARVLQSVKLLHHLPLPAAGCALWIVQAQFSDGGSQSYLLPVRFTASAEEVPQKAVIGAGPSGCWSDACFDAGFRNFLLEAIHQKQRLKFDGGELQFSAGKMLLPYSDQTRIASRVLEAEQSNTAMIYEPEQAGDGGFFLKIYRRLQAQLNPEVEVSRYLTEQARFGHIPPYAGAVHWKPVAGKRMTLAILQKRVNAQADLWRLWSTWLSNGGPSLPEPLLLQAALLAKRTAALHQALADFEGHSAFLPEPFNSTYCARLVRRCRQSLRRVVQLLQARQDLLQGYARDWARYFLTHHHLAEGLFGHMLTKQLLSLRIRIHGDYHLGQVLFDGSDLIILDFEGEPDQTLLQRRTKHSPLKDVAGMLRSFHYVLWAPYLIHNTLPDAAAQMHLRQQYQQLADCFLQHYYAAGISALQRADASEIEFLLQFHIMEKTIYELGYELNSRPTWVGIPLLGVVSLLETLANSSAL
ncbi:MAG: phosphotransferase [Chitinophagales bacterium]|nr:phosphotransferase [Chitinophagales bacterium]MDW8427277.1 phosphotransferase [Chitinophagales bacterium]